MFHWLRQNEFAEIYVGLGFLLVVWIYSVVIDKRHRKQREAALLLANSNYETNLTRQCGRLYMDARDEAPVSYRFSSDHNHLGGDASDCSVCTRRLAMMEQMAGMQNSDPDKRNLLGAAAHIETEEEKEKRILSSQNCIGPFESAFDCPVHDPRKR